jgi:hypothetical protein
MKNSEMLTSVALALFGGVSVLLWGYPIVSATVKALAKMLTA